MLVHQFSESELTLELAHGIATVAGRCFSSDKSVEDRVAEMMAEERQNSLEFSTGRRFVIADENGIIVAHARTFIRQIKSEIDDSMFPVLALATVCTDPDQRGKGLGAQVTKLAFEQVGKDDWPKISLFQTPVPFFYEKLNCRLVENKFVDRTNSAAPDDWPWSDDTAMIYPATAIWPAGTIDINGPSY